MKTNKRAFDKKVVLAVDIGGTWVKLAVINVQGLMIERIRIKTNLTNKGQYIAEEITSSFQEILAKDSLKGVIPIAMGIGIPGFPDLNGKVRFSGNIGWKNYDITKDLKKWWSLPIVVYNDCAMAALGEKFIGKAKGIHNFVFIALGTGLGSGIIINDELYQGNGGTAGEIGHIPIQGMNPEFQCSCGLPECAEPVFSATGIVNLFRKYKKKFPKLKTSAVEDGKSIWDGVRSGDKISIMAAKEFSEFGGRVLAVIAMFLNPEVIYLGGGLAHDNETLIEYLKPVFERFTHGFIRETTRYELGTVGNDSALYGCAYAGMKLAGSYLHY